MIENLFIVQRHGRSEVDLVKALHRHSCQCCGYLGYGYCWQVVYDKGNSSLGCRLAMVHEMLKEEVDDVELAVSVDVVEGKDMNDCEKENDSGTAHEPE